ncbi:hypothetical protein [Paenibacillus sp. B-A-8]|uniref:hypothetical protein n=1 Tax=Paenibacillus sp. B-A-8 TaxID=3400419 RepID=UPI003B0172DB
MSDNVNQDGTQPEAKLRLEELQEKDKSLSDTEMKEVSGGAGTGKLLHIPSSAVNGKGYKMG